MSKNLVYLDEMDSKLNRKLLELDDRKAARDCLNNGVVEYVIEIWETHHLVSLDLDIKVRENLVQTEKKQCFCSHYYCRYFS